MRNLSKIEKKTIGSTSKLFLEYSQSVKICHISDFNELTELIRYLQVLMGLKGDYMLSESSQMVLINFIQKFLSKYTCDELRFGVELAIAGKYSVENKNFEKNPLSGEYIVKCMSAYEIYARNNGFKRELIGLPEKNEDYRSETDKLNEAMLLSEIAFNESIKDKKNYFKFTKEGKELLFYEQVASIYYNHKIGKIGKCALNKDERKEVFDLAVDEIKKRFSKDSNTADFVLFLQILESGKINENKTQKFINKVIELSRVYAFERNLKILQNQ